MAQNVANRKKKAVVSHNVKTAEVVVDEVNNDEVETDEVVTDEVVTDEVDNFVETDEVVTYANVIKKLIASGCKRIKSVRVKNVNYTEEDNYTMVSFNIGTPIEGFVSNDGGVTYERGKTNIIFTSTYAIAGTLKEDEELGWMANALVENPKALNLIFNGCTIDIIQQEVVAGEEYKNPFSTRTDVEPQVYDHNIIINHIVGFKLGKVGSAMALRLADKMMGF